MEKPIRSMVKAISWRIVATLTTILLLVVVFSKDLALGTLVGITELIVKTVVYYVHERFGIYDFGREVKKQSAVKAGSSLNIRYLLL